MVFDVDNFSGAEAALPSRFDTPVWMLAVGQTLIWAAIFYSFPALVLHWEAEFGWSNAEIMGALTCALLAWALVAPLFGGWIDKGRGAWLLAGSAAIGSLALAMVTLVQSLTLFYVLWIVIGFTMGGALYEACFAVVTRTRGARAKRAITLITLIAGLASTLCYPVIHLVAGLAGWRTALLVLCCGGLFVAAPLAWFAARRLEQTPVRPAAAPDVPKAPATPHVMRQAAFWFLAAGFAAMTLHSSMVTSHIMPVLADRGFETGLAVMAASCIGPMQVAGRLAIMLFARETANWKLSALSFLSIIVAGLCLLMSNGSVFLLAVFVILHGAGWGTTSILRPVVTREILGEKNFGAISGSVAVFSVLALACAPLLGSLLFGIGGYSMALAFGITASLAGLILFLLSTRGIRARAPV